MGAGLQTATSPAGRKGFYSTAISDAKDLASFEENISSLLQIMRETVIPRAAILLDLAEQQATISISQITLLFVCINPESLFPRRHHEGG